MWQAGVGVVSREYRALDIAVQHAQCFLLFHVAGYRATIQAHVQVLRVSSLYPAPARAPRFLVSRP